MKKTMCMLALAVAASSSLLLQTTLLASVTDDRIEATAKQTYVFRTYLKDDSINVMSKAGDVTLTGTVSEESHKYLARDTVSSMPGVKSVDNKLTLKGRAPAAGTDAWLITKVKFTLLFHKNVNASGTKVFASKGVVTLRGKAASVAQKDLTTEYVEESHKYLARDTVSSMPGVKSVDNKLTLKGQAPAAGTDAWLITKVKFTLLFHKNVNATGTKVFASKGVVTLRGKAASVAQKDLTTEYVEDVDGVKSVKNEMTVAGAARKPGKSAAAAKMDGLGESVDDASITALVKATLFYHRSTSALNTTVETKDGVVTLAGKARNAAEKDLAEKLVSDVHGVKKVVNDITVG